MEGIMIAGNCSEQFDHPLKMKIWNCMLTFLYSWINNKENIAKENPEII